MIFLMIHKIFYYKVRVSTGSVETRWLGWQFLNSYKKQRWQAGCLLHQCVLRNTLAGSKTWFLCPETLLYPINYKITKICDYLGESVSPLRNLARAGLVRVSYRF